MNSEMKSKLLNLSEIVLVTAGALLLISLLMIKGSADFNLWVIAKILYGVGVISFIFFA